MDTAPGPALRTAHRTALRTALRNSGGTAVSITRLRGHRGLTLIEMAVVLVLIGGLLAIMLPKLAGAENFAESQRAQTTASGGLDTAVRLYLASGERDGDGCAAAASAPRQQMDPGPYDDVAATSCPPFANPLNLGAANGDVTFVAGDRDSTAPTTVSVAGQKTTAGWRVAVATLAAAAGPDGTPSCWSAWHQFPSASSANGSGSSLERYFVARSADAGNCTGNRALTLATGTACGTPTDGAKPFGLSWRRPCPADGTD